MPERNDNDMLTSNRLANSVPNYPAELDFRAVDSAVSELIVAVNVTCCVSLRLLWRLKHQLQSCSSVFIDIAEMENMPGRSMNEQLTKLLTSCESELIASARLI